MAKTIIDQDILEAAARRKEEIQAAREAEQEIQANPPTEASVEIPEFLREINERMLEAMAARDAEKALIPAEAEEKTTHLPRVFKSITQELEEERKAGHQGFMARSLIQATMPHSKPKEAIYIRKNGRFLLTMATTDPKIGLPYGPIPRLLMSFITTEASQTQSREILLADTLSEFMKDLGYDMPRGGKRGNIKPLKDQMLRLFSAVVKISHNQEDRATALQMLLVDGYDIHWWQPIDPNQHSLFESKVVLSELFFKEIITNPVPVNIATLRALKSSAFMLDIYIWLTYKNSYDRQVRRISWESLQMQLGAGYPLTKRGKIDFRANFEKALKKVLLAYPEAGAHRVESDYFLYVPGKPDIPPKPKLK